MALAQETGSEPASGADAETLIEVEVGQSAAVNPDNVGTAAQALVGKAVSDIEGMEVFDSGGERIGSVSMAAESESGALFIIVAADENATFGPGQHAVPLVQFDYDADADALVLRDNATTPSASGEIAVDQARATNLYTVLASDAVIEEVGLEAYGPLAQAPDAADVDRPDDASPGDVVVGDARQVLESHNITDLEGRDILSADREEIATVEAVAYDDQGQVYLIASYGGFLDIGDEYRAVPLDAFTYSVDQEGFIFTEGGEETLLALPAWTYDQPGYTVVETDLDWRAFERTQSAETIADEPLPSQEQATELEVPMAGEEQATTETEEPTAGEEQVVTETEEPMTGEEQAATETEEPMAGEEQAATETEEPTAGEEQVATETEEPMTGEEQAATAAGDEAASQVEPSAGAQQGAPATDAPITMTDEGADAEAVTEEAAGNARQVLAEQGVTDVEGLDIYNAELEDIGTVEHIAQDAEGKLYLIVSLDDGILGIGDSERVVSLDAFDYLPDEEAFVLLDVSEERLEAMQEWDTDNAQYTIIETDLDWTAYN